MTDDEIMRILEDHEERIKRVESSSGEFQTFREVIAVYPPERTYREAETYIPAEEEATPDRIKPRIYTVRR